MNISSLFWQPERRRAGVTPGDMGHRSVALTYSEEKETMVRFHHVLPAAGTQKLHEGSLQTFLPIADSWKDRTGG